VFIAICETSQLIDCEESCFYDDSPRGLSCRTFKNLCLFPSSDRSAIGAELAVSRGMMRCFQGPVRIGAAFGVGVSAGHPSLFSSKIAGNACTGSWQTGQTTSMTPSPFIQAAALASTVSVPLRASVLPHARLVSVSWSCYPLALREARKPPRCRPRFDEAWKSSPSNSVEAAFIRLRISIERFLPWPG
jgi:hypothetical protein